MVFFQPAHVDVGNLVSMIDLLPAQGALEIDLPTQAEWELSAQGNRLYHHAVYPWTESFPFYEDVSFVGEDGLRCERALTMECGYPVAPINYAPLGQSSQTLFDLGGNAAEWVIDSDGYRLVGGGAMTTSSYLRLSTWVEDHSDQIDTLSPEGSRGARLVIRTR